VPRAQALLERLPLWLAALWWGSLSTIGFLVVPLLFVHLPTPALAGAMAARLFTAQTWVSVLCGLLLLLVSRRNQTSGDAGHVQEAIIFIAGGMLLALLAEFAVAPRIVARENLALWHRVGSGMYLLQWLCAGVTFWKMAAPTRGTEV
jgi:Domain of unknown function (DUF4149)